MQEQFMRRALDIARTSLDIPGALPYGAVVVRDGRIVGEGLNKALALNDPVRALRGKPMQPVFQVRNQAAGRR